MRKLKLKSSISFRKFLLIFNAVLFVANTNYVQSKWNEQVIDTQSEARHNDGPSRSTSALAEGLSSFRQPQKEENVNSTADEMEATGGSSPSAILLPASEGHRPSRTFMGIFSKADNGHMRSRHRTLIGLWNDTRLCSWHQITPKCQLVYAFVLGAGGDQAPTQLVNETGNTDKKWPLLVEKPIITEYPDLNDEDTVLLNIRENMNEGKSESFFYFASTIMKEHSIDYVMKIDSDSSLLFHKFLVFAKKELPPAPYYRRILAGSLRDKDRWNLRATENLTSLVQKEDYWMQEYDSVHVYLAGQCYLLSRDLVNFVVEEAPRSSGYVECQEDHDLSSMAFRSPKPVTLLIIPKKHRFWEHPVKGRPRWLGILKRETARMKGEIYKGKKLRNT